jgi:hypothetical protein
MSEGGLNLSELSMLLERFGITLDQFAASLGVTRGALAGAHISLDDLERFGIGRKELKALGITNDDLKRIGVDVSKTKGN